MDKNSHLATNIIINENKYTISFVLETQKQNVNEGLGILKETNLHLSRY